LLIEGAGHNDIHSVAPDQYRRKLREFYASL